MKPKVCFVHSIQELNPNVEAKLSYLLKFVQKSVEENKEGETTFKVKEVGLLHLLLTDGVNNGGIN